MKKMFVLTLVLVFALGSTAAAGIEWSGEFESELSVDTFEPDEVNWELKNTLTLEVSATGEGLGWEFEGELAAPTTDGDLDTGAFELGEYKLTLTDDYFTAWVWGNEAETETKASNLGFISADAAADAAVRAEVPLMDVTTLTVDYRQTNGAHEGVRAFADFMINDFELGLAGARYYGVPGDPANTVVASAGTTIDMFTIDGAVGATMGEELGYALGADLSADVTEEVEVGLTAWASSPDFVADVDSNTVDVEMFVDYTDPTDYFWAKATLGFDGTFDEFSLDNNSQMLEAAYRMDDTVDFGDVLDDYMDLTAPAASGWLEREDTGGDVVLSGEVGAASPLMADFLWGKLAAGFQLGEGMDYDFMDEEDATIDRELYFNADAYVAVSERLTVEPHLGFRNIANADSGSALLTSVDAGYFIAGNEDLELGMSVSNEAFFGDFVGDEMEMQQSASMSITVSF